MSVSCGLPWVVSDKSEKKGAIKKIFCKQVLGFYLHVTMLLLLNNSTITVVKKTATCLLAACNFSMIFCAIIVQNWNGCFLIPKMYLC